VIDSVLTTNWMAGTITALTVNTSITVNVDTVAGSGAIATWAFAVDGLTGSQGPQGVPALITYAAATASAGVNTTETVLETLTITAGALAVVGTHVRITLLGACSSTAANASTFTIRAGTLGTTGDASLAAPTVTSAWSAYAPAFRVVIEFTVRSSTTLAGTLSVYNSDITGIAAASVSVVPFTYSGLPLNTSTKLSITYKTAASTTTSVFQNAVIELL